MFCSENHQASLATFTNHQLPRRLRRPQSPQPPLALPSNPPSNLTMSHYLGISLYFTTQDVET